MTEERERFFSRLATVPGVRTMPSVGSWILVAVDDPADLARKVNRRLEPGTVSVPRHIPGAVRVAHAGCMSWAKFSHWSKTFDRITHNSRKAGVNPGLGSFFCWIRSKQIVNWLSTARSRAARTALG